MIRGGHMHVLFGREKATVVGAKPDVRAAILGITGDHEKSLVKARHVVGRLGATWGVGQGVGDIVRLGGGHCCVDERIGGDKRKRIGHKLLLLLF